MPQDAASIAVSWGMIALGALALVVALGLALPVGVNLPESWFGVVIIAAIASAGLALVYRGMRRLLVRS